MDQLVIPATDRSPEIRFDFLQGTLCIKGESYPEDVPTFYSPVMSALERYLTGPGKVRCRFDFELIYFNSSSAKIIMNILQRLDEAARRGAEVAVYWFYDPEDDTMQELGEEFGEDLENASFHLEARRP